MKKFLLTTLVGGVLFLVPLVFIVLILGKAHEIMAKVALPLGRLVPVDTVAGVGVINLLAILLLLLTCLLAGLLARSRLARAFYQKIDRVLLELIPGYAWTKATLASMGGNAEVSEQFKPVLVTLDDQMLIGFEMERAGNDQVVVFFPGAPDVRSGTVAYVTADRVQPLDTNLMTINKCLKLMGIGAARLVPAGTGTAD
jgi:uncharacterized membrane protein